MNGTHPQRAGCDRATIASGEESEVATARYRRRKSFRPERRVEIAAPTASDGPDQRSTRLAFAGGSLGASTLVGQGAGG